MSRFKRILPGRRNPKIYAAILVVSHGFEPQSSDYKSSALPLSYLAVCRAETKPLPPEQSTAICTPAIMYNLRWIFDRLTHCISSDRLLVPHRGRDSPALIVGCIELRHILGSLLGDRTISKRRERGFLPFVFDCFTGGPAPLKEEKGVATMFTQIYYTTIQCVMIPQDMGVKMGAGRWRPLFLQAVGRILQTLTMRQERHHAYFYQPSYIHIKSSTFSDIPYLF